MNFVGSEKRKLLDMTKVIYNCLGDVPFVLRSVPLAYEERYHMKKRINKNNVLFATKVFIVAAAAIIIALICRLEFPISAGIVAILSVAGTKRETFKTAINRFFAFVAALGISYICFMMMGITTISFLIYLFLFIFLCQAFQWNNAMAMNSVLISHFLTFGKMGIHEIMNELLIFIIGVGLGVLVNLTLRKNVKSMEKLKEETDEMMKVVLARMGERIIDPNLENYDGSCFAILRDLVRSATVLAKTNYNNQYFIEDTYDIEYISMREKQVDMLYVMYKDVNKINKTYISSKALSDFFKKVSEEYSRENTVKTLMEDYQKLDEYMKNEIPIPKDREEFENRARLFSIMRNMEEFLVIKHDYMLYHE